MKSRAGELREKLDKADKDIAALAKAKEPPPLDLTARSKPPSPSQEGPDIDI